MSFATTGPVIALLGLLALAGLLFLLQRLRVRHRPVVVETGLFWKQAVEEARARVFVQRFRHPWTYALLLLIASLLWLAFTGPRLVQNGEREHLVLVDGSAAMAAGGRFEEAAALAVDYAAGLPADRRTVVLCGGRPETLLRPGEELVLLEQRLAAHRAQASPATVARTLASYAHLAATRPIDVCVIGPAVLDEGEQTALPDTFTVRRLPVERDGTVNRGIVALGVRAAASGRWDAVDVLVEVLTTDAAEPAAPRLDVDGAASTAAPVIERTERGARFRFAEVPAHGGTLTARLPDPDGLPLDDVARFALPDRRALPVAIAPGLPAVLRQLVAADPGLRLVTSPEESPAAVFRRHTDRSYDGVPAIVLTDTETVEDAFLVMVPGQVDPQEVLHELCESLGLAEIDARALAQASGRTITMGASPGALREVLIWEDLLREDFDFTSSRSFPLFFGLALRWLAGYHEGPSRVAVGEPLATQDAPVTGPDGGVVQALSPVFVPTAIGDHTTEAGFRFAASLLDAESSLGPLTADALPSAAATTTAGLDLVTAALLLALLLLVWEWWLHRRGTIA